MIFGCQSTCPPGPEERPVGLQIIDLAALTHGNPKDLRSVTRIYVGNLDKEVPPEKEACHHRPLIALSGTCVQIQCLKCSGPWPIWINLQGIPVGLRSGSRISPESSKSMVTSWMFGCRGSHQVPLPGALILGGSWRFQSDNFSATDLLMRPIMHQLGHISDTSTLL